MAYLDPVWNNIYEEYVHNVVALVELLITRYDLRPSSTPFLKYRVQRAPTLNLFSGETSVRESSAYASRLHLLYPNKKVAHLR